VRKSGFDIAARVVPARVSTRSLTGARAVRRFRCSLSFIRLSGFRSLRIYPLRPPAHGQGQDTKNLHEMLLEEAPHLYLERALVRGFPSRK
jgi:hypothetical protein